MFTNFINFILLIILLLPNLQNISILETSPNDEMDSSFNKEINNINDSEVLFLLSFNPNTIINILEQIKEKPEILKNITENSKNIIEIIANNLFISNEDLGIINRILDGLKNDSKPIDSLIQIINNNKTLIDCIIQIININTNYSNKINIFIRIEETLKILKNLLIYNEDIFDFIYNFIEEYKDLLIFLKIFQKSMNISEIDIDSFIRFFQDNFKILFNLFKDIINDYDRFYYVLSQFLKNNIDKSIELLKLLRNNTQVLSKLITLLINDNLINEIIIVLLEHKKYMPQILDIFINNSSLIKEAAEILENIKNYEVLLIKIPFFISKHKEFNEIISNIIYNFINSNSKNSETIEFLGNIFRQNIKVYFDEHIEEITNSMSEECIAFLNYTILGFVSKEEFYNKLGRDKIDKNISYYYLYKILFDTTKNKNDLLKYENCLYKPPILKRIKNSDLNYMDHHPTFIISIIDFFSKNNSNIKKNITSFDTSFFIFGMCFPQGNNTNKNEMILKNNTKSYYHCNAEDYKFLMNLFIRIFMNVNTISIEQIEINDKIDKKSTVVKNLIPLLILIIPIFINFILLIYKKICIKKKENVIMIHKIREVINGEDDDDINDLINNNDDKVKKKIKILPKWYKVLNEFFNIKNNLNELFNYDSSEINKINLNNKGIIYIKGIFGLSIIFTILGQLYLIFFNLPMKQFGIFQFHELISNVTYIFLFVGLRYSPRIIFSCSGYILTYKYLSFIEQDSGYYLIKFFFFHFYKYILFIIFIFFIRNSLLEIINIIFGIKPMVKIFDRIVLKKPYELSEFLFNLFNLGSFWDIACIFSTNDKLKYSIDIFDYFWMAYNEMFFFIFGILLISLGYKVKIKIDYIIIILIMILIALKIIFYYSYYKYKDVYTTLYYYIFDYGRIMLNPIFNLSYFLIGMYFGLINYSVQKGITQISKDNYFNNDITNKKFEKPNIISEIKERSFSSFNNENIFLQNRKNVIDLSYKFRGLSFMKNNNNEIDIFNDNKTNDRRFKSINLYNIKEMESMPFLISTITFIEWHRKDSSKFLHIIIIVFLILFIVFLSSLNFIFVTIFNKKIKNRDINNNYNEVDRLNEELLLEGFISDEILNCIYLFDIELYVFLTQWLFFFLYMKGQYFFMDFFSHIYWSFFIKTYFSFLMVCNPIILIIFYESETVIKLNFLIICLYYFINLIHILLISIVFYIAIDLPFKKLFKYIVRRDKNFLNLEENEDDDNEDEDEGDQDEDNKN